MKKVLLAFGWFVVTIITCLAVAAVLFDPNAYRTKIAEQLSAQTNREVALSGPMKLKLSRHGLAFSITDVSLGNPAWASRSHMATIGQFELGVALLPLLQQHVVITGLKISDADILLESVDDQRVNWGFISSSAHETKEQPSPVPESDSSSAPRGGVSIDVDHVDISNSRIGLRKGETTTTFRADSLTLEHEIEGIVLRLTGNYNGLPVTLRITTNTSPISVAQTRPFDINLIFAKLNLRASGKINLADKQAMMEAYALTAGDSNIHGKLAMDWGSQVPSLVGTVLSNNLSPSDFAIANPTSPSTAPIPDGKSTNAASAEEAPYQLFSDASFDLTALRKMDALFDVAIDALMVGPTKIEKIDGKVSLKKGMLLVSPVSATLGRGSLEGQAHLNANPSTPHLGMTLKAAGINLSDILQASGLDAFLSTGVDADLNIVSDGNSPHALASNLSGTLNLVGAEGDVVSGTSDEIIGTLAGLLTGSGLGGSKNKNLNCLVARFTASHGIVRDNGILLDSVATTLVGKGNINLSDETLNFQFKAKPKHIALGNLLPSMQISGTFLHPSLSLDKNSIKNSIVSSVAGLLTGNSTAPLDDIPSVTSDHGQNACLTAINHIPNNRENGGAVDSEASPPTGKVGVVPELMNKAGSALKGLFGQ